MNMKLLLCLLPVMAHAQITVNIQASKAAGNTFTNAMGESRNVITTDDEKLFNITEDTLKNAVLALTKRTPTNVYLKSPTPWNDLYKTYGWEPVKTVIKPYKLRVVDIKTSNLILKRRKVSNEDSVAKHEEITLTANIENNVSSSWKQSDLFPAEIRYNVDVIGLGNVPKFELNSTFGRDVEESKIVPVRSASVNFDLKPKTVATVTFAAARVKVAVEVEYRVMLHGYVATNNEVMLKGHHFWAYDITKVMQAANLPYIRKAKEIITIEFYSDGRIVVG